MSLASKIAEAGLALERNLISKGVSCEFGKGSEGKDTIIDMAGMVSQLGDKTQLVIVPSSQYVVADESFVLSVLLYQGGQPLANKTITVEGSVSILNLPFYRLAQLFSELEIEGKLYMDKGKYKVCSKNKF